MKKKARIIEVIGKPPVGSFHHIAVDGKFGEELLEWASYYKTGDIFWNKYRTRDKWSPSGKYNKSIVGGIAHNCRKKNFEDEYYRYNFWIRNDIDYAYIRFTYG